MLRDWFFRPSNRGSRRLAHVHRPRRSRSLRAEVDCLEDRTLLTATSAVSWASAGLIHTALYAIGQKDNVEVSVDGGRFNNLGFYAKQVSAGLDAHGQPEVFAIGANNAVWVNHALVGPGVWTSLGGYAKQISADVADTVYAIGTDDAVWVNSHESGWVRLGGYARQISAGEDAIDNPEVFYIGADNAVYVTGGLGGFAKLGGYAKQISATMLNTVYAIGGDNFVYESSRGGPWVSLGGYAKQISASLDSIGRTQVFAIGLNDGLWVNDFSWVSLGTNYVTEVSAPPFAIDLAGNLAYAVAQGHGGLLHQGSSFISLGGYIQTLSGSTTNDTNSWAPATRDASSISWASGGRTHTAFYAIGPNDNVEESIDGGPFTNLGGYAKQVSAGLNAFNQPEVYAIGADNAVWDNQGSGWVSLGGYAKQISATVNNTFYHIGTDDAVYLGHGGPFPTGYVRLGGGGSFKQISAGADLFGNTFVFAIGYDNAVYYNNGDLHTWGALGGYAKQISAAMNHVVYAIGIDNAVYENTGTFGVWTDLGGYAKQISASATNVSGLFVPSSVFAIGPDDGLWVNSGSGFVSLGGYVTEVGAPPAGNFGISLPFSLAYVVAKGHGAFLHDGSFLSIAGGTIE